MPLIVRAVCARPLSHERALKGKAALEATIKAPLDPATLVRQETVEAAGDNARAGASILHCNEAALSGSELADAQALEARATKWADAADRVIAAEQDVRERVVSYVCQSDLLLEQNRAEMVHERANPSGYVDKGLLHKIGSDIQYYQEQLATLAPQYQAVRHHAFAGWRTEGACIAARRGQ
jgi:hypothetical protein